MTEDQKRTIDDDQLIDGARAEIMRWLNDPQADAGATLAEVMRLFEASGRPFVKADYSSDD
jgi:hypothetical protein